MGQRNAVWAYKLILFHSISGPVIENRPANCTQLSLYFGVGLYVSANSREGTWGTGAIDAISEQLHRELPGLRGFSAKNIRNMRQFAEFWQPFLFHSPAASKIDIKELSSEIEYDRFALAKWSPWRAKLIVTSFWVSVFHITWKFCIRRKTFRRCFAVSMKPLSTNGTNIRCEMY